MADIASDDVVEASPANPAPDAEMTEAGAEDETAVERTELPFAGEETVVEPEPARVPFIDYLTSPVVTLIVGNGEQETFLTAHQGLLAQSPYFQAQCDAFADDGSASTESPRIGRSLQSLGSDHIMRKNTKLIIVASVSLVNWS